MSDVIILQQSAEQMNTIDQTFDLVYYDPPFGLQRDFSMLEMDGETKVSLTIGNPLMIILHGMQILST